MPLPNTRGAAVVRDVSYCVTMSAITSLLYVTRAITSREYISGSRTTNSIWHITCSRRGAGPYGFHRSCNSFTSSPARTGPCVMCRPLPANEDSSLCDVLRSTCTPAGISSCRYLRVVSFYVTTMTSQPPSPSKMQPLIELSSVVSSLAGAGGWLAAIFDRHSKLHPFLNVDLKSFVLVQMYSYLYFFSSSLM